jgi:hypothetical protein
MLVPVALLVQSHQTALLLDKVSAAVLAVLELKFLVAVAVAVLLGLQHL